MWGQIAGAVIGGVMANKRAKDDRKAMDKANAANMAGFNQYKPYVDAGLKGGQDAFNSALNAGYYQGPTLAGTNPYASAAANTMGGFAPSIMSSGYDMFNLGSGFGQNYRDLYDRAQQDSLSGAIDYANENAGALTDALMSDARRNTQLAMQGNNMAASGTGNVNSSRAGIADAALNSELARQTAATGETVRNSLIDRKMNADAAAFSRSMDANAQLANTYNNALNTMSTGAGFGMDAGRYLQGEEQNRLNDERARFEGNRDYAYNMYKDYMSGMLGRAPTTGNSAQPNMVNPAAATLGGAMTGFGFGQQYGPQIASMFGFGRPVQFGSGTVYGNTGNSMGASYAPPYLSRG
jgi:hypothetical protein